MTAASRSLRDDFDMSHELASFVEMKGAHAPVMAPTILRKSQMSKKPGAVYGGWMAWPDPALIISADASTASKSAP